MCAGLALQCDFTYYSTLTVDFVILASALGSNGSAPLADDNMTLLVSEKRHFLLASITSDLFFPDKDLSRLNPP